MSDSPGTALSFAIAVPPSGLTPDLVATWASNDFSVRPPSALILGTSSAFTPITVTHWDSPGILKQIVGETLFEKILVSPRTAALGFTAIGNQFPIEVWNTFSATNQVLSSITFGPGLSIPDPYGMPTTFKPYQSRVYTAYVTGDGPPAMNQSVVFVFFSGISGTDVAVSYLMMTLFSLAPNWSAGIKESIDYLTDVLSAYSDSEQRRGIRSLPRRNFVIHYTTVDARSAALLDALLWGWQHRPYGVPMWPDAVRLTADLAIGSSVVPIPTSDRVFVAGGFVTIWTTPFSFDIAKLSAVASGSVTLGSPTQFLHKAGSLVVPVVMARVKDDVSLFRYSSVGDTIDVTFEGEGSQIVRNFSADVTFPTYKGYDVLEVAPNWGANLSRNYKRSMIGLDSKTGGIWVDDRAGSPRVGTPISWFLGSHADVTPLRSFLDQRKGQLVPFWLPTWDVDLVLAAPITATATTLSIQWIGYTRYFFQNQARRYLAFMRIGQAPIFREIVGAFENADGTETLTLDSSTGVALPVDVQISFLALSRQDSDSVEIDWASTDQGQANLAMREIPSEVPA